MIKKIVFKCNHYPNQLTLHALLSTIFDNEHQNKNDIIYKLYYIDKEIYLIIDDIQKFNLQDKYKFKHKLENGQIIDIFLTKVKEENFIFPIHKKGEIVKVYGTIHYSINKGKKNIHKKYGEETKNISNICPIDQYGNFIADTRQHTLNYLQEKIGINLFEERFQRTQSFKYINPLAFNNHFNKSNKIRFYNAFSISLEGHIENEDILNKLHYCSIAQKRSYGLGNLFIVGYNEQETI